MPAVRYPAGVRIECEGCGELVTPSWQLVADELAARCPACDGVSRARVEPAAPRGGPSGDGGPAAAAPGRAEGDRGGPTCPKCGYGPARGAACVRCGLAVDRMAGWSEVGVVPDALAEAWAACRAAWREPAAHDRVASLAVALGEQPWLARRYREALRAQPGDAVAAAGLERAARIAQAAVLATAAPPRPPLFRRGSAYTVLVALTLLVIGGLLWALYLVRTREPAATGKRTPATPALRRASPPASPAASPPVPVPRVESRPPGE